MQLPEKQNPAPLAGGNREHISFEPAENTTISDPPASALSSTQFRWLLKSGVDVATLLHPYAVTTCKGLLAADGYFDPDPSGADWLIFPQGIGTLHEDFVFWQPRTNELATWTGRSFALGEDVIDRASTYSFDCHLNVFGDPLSWLLAKRDGIVVRRWDWAFDRLGDKRRVPRVSVSDSMLRTYERAMRPRMPELFVHSSDWRTAA